MSFNPDIVVTEPSSSHLLLIVEAKTTAPESQSESKLKRYMWEMSCPVGLFASPRVLVLYRNLFSDYSDDSVQKIGEFSSPKSWTRFEGQRSATEFEIGVQSWLEKLRESSRTFDVPEATKEALWEYVLPSLLKGEIHAAGPGTSA
jgi:hypothetical protein